MTDVKCLDTQCTPVILRLSLSEIRDTVSASSSFLYLNMFVTQFLIGKYGRIYCKSAFLIGNSGL